MHVPKTVSLILQRKSDLNSETAKSNTFEVSDNFYWILNKDTPMFSCS